MLEIFSSDQPFKRYKGSKWCTQTENLTCTWAKARANLTCPNFQLQAFIFKVIFKHSKDLKSKCFQDQYYSPSYHLSNAPKITSNEHISNKLNTSKVTSMEFYSNAQNMKNNLATLSFTSYKPCLTFPCTMPNISMHHVHVHALSKLEKILKLHA